MPMPFTRALPGCNTHVCRYKLIWRSWDNEQYVLIHMCFASNFPET